MNKLKRIAIMGSGGVGGYFGARLAQNGVDVTFIARGAHLRAMQKNGLRIQDNGEEFLIKPVCALEDVHKVKPVDVILLTVKLGDTEEALRLCKLLMHDETFIVSFQNGVESVDLISNSIGVGRALGGAAYVVSNIIKPGVIRKTAPVERLEFAEVDGVRSQRALAFERLLRAAGIDANLMADMQELLWRKFALLSASSAMTALTRQPMGYMQSDPAAQEIMSLAVSETLAVASALGVRLDVHIEKSTMYGLNHLLRSDTKASQLVDMEHGKSLELEWLSGAIRRFGLQTGVPTPIHSTAYVALVPFAAGRE